VSEAHLRRVGRDSLISFGGSSYSVPARANDRRVTPRVSQFCPGGGFGLAGDDTP